MVVRSLSCNQQGAPLTPGFHAVRQWPVADCLHMCLCQVKSKVNHAPEESIVGAHLSLLGLEPVGGEPLMFLTRGKCDARLTVTSLATRYHRPLAGSKLYCLVTQAHVCWQLAQGFIRQLGGWDSNICHQTVKFGIGQWMVMVCSCEGNSWLSESNVAY